MHKSYGKRRKNNRVWQANYPSGVDAEVKLDTYANIGEMLDAACDRFGPQVAFENMDVQLRYNEVAQYSRDFAAYLQQLGLKPGDRIAIQMPNLLQYPIVLFAALQAGLVVVNTNPLYTAEEMRHQFSQAGHLCNRNTRKLRRQVADCTCRRPPQEAQSDHRPYRRSAPSSKKGTDRLCATLRKAYDS